MQRQQRKFLDRKNLGRRKADLKGEERTLFGFFKKRAALLLFASAMLTQAIIYLAFLDVQSIVQRFDRQTARIELTQLDGRFNALKSELEKISWKAVALKEISERKRTVEQGRALLDDSEMTLHSYEKYRQTDEAKKGIGEIRALFDAQKKVYPVLWSLTLNNTGATDDLARSRLIQDIEPSNVLMAKGFEHLSKVRAQNALQSNARSKLRILELENQILFGPLVAKASLLVLAAIIFLMYRFLARVPAAPIEPAEPENSGILEQKKPEQI